MSEACVEEKELGSDAEERALWDRAREGDRDALDRLLRDHERRIYRFGLRMCGDEEAAREVLQRTLLTAFEQIGSFRGDARISTWLYSIARSACSRLHRRTRSAPVHDIPLDAPAGVLTLESHEPDPGRAAEQSEMAELVAAAIDALSDSHREIVLLRDVEGLSAEEAAQATGLAIPALKSRLHRGRQQLKENLAILIGERGGAVNGGKPCARLVEELSHQVGATIDHSACQAIERHMEGCPSCARSFAGLRDAASLCRRLSGTEVPEPVQRAVRAALTDALGSAHRAAQNPA